MITRDLIITVNDDVSVLNEPITLYRGDRGITLNCKIVQYKFQFMRTTDGNVITGTNIINARVLVHKPDGNGCFEVPLAKVKDDIVVIPISADWLDEISEIGTYRLQIQLYGEDPVQQRVTIPPIEFTVQDTLCDIKENFTDIAGYALTDTSAIKLKGDSYNADLNNGYTPTIWVTGDIITSTSLNKMEEAIEYSVNKVNAINGVEDNDKVDYMGNKHKSLKDKADADVEYILGEVNTAHYEGQRITATDTIERQVRSAILSGQTLVNLIKDNTEDGVLLTEGHKDLKLLYTLKNSTQYTLLMNVVSVNDNNTSNCWCGILKTGDWGSESKRYVKGINKLLFTTQEESDCYAVRIRGLGTTIKNVMLLEGDYTNVDIPYFTGMQSVKMPVLTTTGKNLFDEEWESGSFNNTTGVEITDSNTMRSKNYIKVDPNETYTIDTNAVKIFYDKNYNVISVNTSTSITTTTFNTPENCYYMRIRMSYSDYSNNKFTKQIEQGTQATSYEPFKSNILSTPEDVELGSVGNVKDELNLVTGELTQRTDIRAYQEGDESNSEVLTDMTNTRYKLAKEIVKTVDLKGQKVYSYDGTTHYTCSAAEGSLVPTLSIDVPTNLPALVSRQRATIQALTVENQEIKAVNEAQDTEIELNQEAINFMLFHSTSMMLSEQTKGINPMSTYLANQIIKGKLSYDLVVEKYEDFKEDIDIILMDKRGEELDKLNK